MLVVLMVGFVLAMVLVIVGMFTVIAGGELVVVMVVVGIVDEWVAVVAVVGFSSSGGSVCGSRCNRSCNGENYKGNKKNLLSLSWLFALLVQPLTDKVSMMNVQTLFFFSSVSLYFVLHRESVYVVEVLQRLYWGPTLCSTLVSPSLKSASF